MWWCCGKRGKEQPGCKFRKHQCKDDEDLGEQEHKDDSTNNKYVRCLCCKELGHRIDQCIRDPNLKTSEFDVNADFERIRKIKDFRKLHTDTAICTSHMIKKAVMIPIEQDDDGLTIEKENTMHPFMRGVMNFDDYNYKQYNEYVLLTGPHTTKNGDGKSHKSKNSVLD